MSPTFYSGYFDVTPFANFGNAVYSNNGYETQKKETKKERISRLAKEKMFASWKTYNQKTETIIEVKQICKPKHNYYR